MSQEELFTLMAHAQDMQKIADTHLAAVNRALKRLEEGTSEALAASIRADIGKTLSEGNTALTKASEGLQRAKNEIAKATSSFRFGVTVYPVVVLVLASFLMAGTFFFAVKWTMNERDRLQEKVDELDYTLQKHAQVTEVQNRKGFWVFIDPLVEPFTTQDGRRVAKLAPPK